MSFSLKFDTTTDDHLWFDEWVKKRVRKIRSDKKPVGTLLTKLEEMFVEGTSKYDTKFLATAFSEIALVVDVKKRSAKPLTSSKGMGLSGL